MLTPPVVGADAFYSVSRTKCKLNVPKNAKSSYAAATTWSEFLNTAELDFYSAVQDVNQTNVKIYSQHSQLVVEKRCNWKYCAGIYTFWHFAEEC